MKVFVCGDEPRKNIQLCMFPSALCSILVLFSALFWFQAPNFTVLVHTQHSHQPSTARLFQEDKKVKCPASNGREKKGCIQLVEHLAIKRDRYFPQVSVDMFASSSVQQWKQVVNATLTRRHRLNWWGC